MRSAAKAVAHAVATLLVAPWLVSFLMKRMVIGRDRSLSGSTQSLGLIPGLIGVYLRGAFLALVLDRFDRSASVHFGTTFSQTGARIDANVYVGPGCHLGLVHLQRDVLIAAGTHIPSGPATHGTDRVDVPIREQEGRPIKVTVGTGTWIGSSAIVLADVGSHSVIAAGSVVTKSIGDYVVAAGVPATVIRTRR